MSAPLCCTTIARGTTPKRLFWVPVAGGRLANRLAAHESGCVTALRRFVLAFNHRSLVASFFGDGLLLPLAIDVRDRQRPKRNQVHSRYKFSSECGQKLPVPAEQVNQHGCDCNIEHVIGGRQSAFGKQREHMKGIGPPWPESWRLGNVSGARAELARQSQQRSLSQ